MGSEVGGGTCAAFLVGSRHGRNTEGSPGGSRAGSESRLLCEATAASRSLRTWRPTGEISAVVKCVGMRLFPTSCRRPKQEAKTSFSAFWRSGGGGTGARNKGDDGLEQQPHSVSLPAASQTENKGLLYQCRTWNIMPLNLRLLRVLLKGQEHLVNHRCSVLTNGSVRIPALKWRRTVNRTQDALALLTAGIAPVPSASYVWQYRNSLCLIEVVLSHSLEKNSQF